MSNNTPSAKMPTSVSSNFVEIEGQKIHYLESGEKEVILMIHGFPTSAYLWRNLMPKLGETHRAIAIDLPGYGKSDKILDASYSFNFYNRILDGFFEKLGIDKVHLAVHDFGGPIGLYWAVKNRERVSSMILLNTLVYPKFSWGVILFSLALRLPMLQNFLTSANGIRMAMRLGVQNSDRIKGELLTQYQSPFAKKADRSVLKKSVTRMHPKGFQEIAEKLPLFDIPVRIIYGENDWVLPKVADTMKLVKKDLPQAEVTALSNCGHFLQEDEPELIAQLISDFLNK